MILKMFIGLVLLGVAGAGLWWSGLLADYIPHTAEAPQEQATTTPQSQTPAPVSDLPTTTNDSSDAALAQDSAAVDVQMAALAQDQKAADDTANDKPTSQEF